MLLNLEHNQAWWQSDGTWKTAPAPEAFLAADKVENADYDGTFFEHGYIKERNCSQRDDVLFDEGLEVTIFRHKDGHLFVDLWDTNERITVFFVAAQDRAPFYATWYMDFVSRLAAQQQSVSVQSIAKTFIAFVRHGHGRRTISEEGMFSLDEQERYERERKAHQR